MVNPELFPPDYDFRISPRWETENNHRRQITIDINSNLFAVINSDYYNNKWQEPVFVIMRAEVPVHELAILETIVSKVRNIMLYIGRPDITRSEIEQLL